MSAILEIAHESSSPSPLSDDEIARTCDLVLEQEHVSRDCDVSVSLVDDDRMAELNGEWRGVDSPTDVLSLELERPDEAHGASPEDVAMGSCVPCELGDIVLAPAFIAEQAPHFENAPADEMRLLLVHGMLHLLGYDHVKEDEAVTMEALEDAIVERLVGSSRVNGGAVTRHGGDES